MKTKIIPFDLEMAKKIQTGEIKGKIIYNKFEAEVLDFNLYFKSHTYICAKVRGNNEKYTTRLFDRYGNDAESNIFHKLMLEVPDDVPQVNSSYSIEQLNKLKEYTEQLMEVNQGVMDDLDCMIQELRKTCNLSLKTEFKPFDKVLVRHSDKTELCVSNSIWIPGIFQYKSVNSNLYFVSGKAYKDCIPYEGNEHLIGTTNKPKED